MFDLAAPQHGASGVAPYMVLYGQNGIGKTTLACMPPSPPFRTLVADVERGIPERLAAIPRFPINTDDELTQLLVQLRDQPHNFTNLVIDSASALSGKIKEKICRQQKWLLPDGSIDMGEKGYSSYGRGEKIEAEKWAVLTDHILRLKEQRNIAVTIVGHVRVAKIKPPDTDEYARYDLALPLGATEVLTQRADIVGFMSYPITTIKNDNRGGLAKAISESDARLYLRSAATHNAKNRFNLPDHITVPSGNPAAGFMEMARYIPYYAALFQQQTQQTQAA